MRWGCFPLLQLQVLFHCNTSLRKNFLLLGELFKCRQLLVKPLCCMETESVTYMETQLCYSVTVNLNGFYSCMVYVSITQLCRYLLTLHITIHVIFSNLISKEAMRYTSHVYLDTPKCTPVYIQMKLCTSNKYNLQFQPIARLNNIFDLIILVFWLYNIIVQPKPWSCGIQFLIGLVSIIQCTWENFGDWEMIYVYSYS